MRPAFFTLLALLVSTDAFAHGMSAADKQRMLESGSLEYIALGARHMLSGYDHLLFLFGVIFFLTRFREIVRFITAFTVGHSITLLLATIYGIKVNYYLIDAVIALTVCYKGFENLDGFKKYLNIKSPDLLRAVFIFGLIHGFGLSTRLQQLPLGETGIIPRIISFNIGVELGQIMALTAMIILMKGWRNRDSFSAFSSVSNRGLVAAGVLLFIMQIHGYTHSAYPDEFGFSQDAHSHAHEEIESEEIRRAREIYKGHKRSHSMRVDQ